VDSAARRLYWAVRVINHQCLLLPTLLQSSHPPPRPHSCNTNYALRQHILLQLAASGEGVRCVGILLCLFTPSKSTKEQARGPGRVWPRREKRGVRRGGRRRSAAQRPRGHGARLRDTSGDDPRREHIARHITEERSQLGLKFSFRKCLGSEHQPEINPHAEAPLVNARGGGFPSAMRGDTDLPPIGARADHCWRG